METLHICFHTHWDREWVQRKEEYKVRLVHLIDNLLDILENEPKLRFFFDGQTIVIEDYLEVFPEQEDRLVALAKAGRLRFGPWYVLGDQFLEGDEATIRNLLIGRRQSKKMGDCGRIGYNPDSFGSIASMPMILNGFGIPYATVSRGIYGLDNPKQALFKWKWKDGSEVLTIARGYANGLSISYPDIWDDIIANPPTVDSAKMAIERLLDRERANYPTKDYYAPAGVDHMEMQAGMQKILESVEEALPDLKIQFSGPDEMLDTVSLKLKDSQETLPLLIQEMRGDSNQPMHLQGVLSTDIVLKRKNRRMEFLLSSVLEPLAVLMDRLLGRKEFHLVQYAWKQVIQSHAHDSICACSTDEVMEDIHSRYDQCESFSRLWLERSMSRFTGNDPSAAHRDQYISIFNGLAGRSFGHCSGFVRLRGRLDKECYFLRDDSGEVVGYANPVGERVIDLESYYASNKALVSCSRKKPSSKKDFSHKVETISEGLKRPDESVYTLMNVNILKSSNGYVGFEKLRLEQDNTCIEPKVQATDQSIENEFIKLSVSHEGKLDLWDKNTGQVYEGLCGLEDMADAGDSYDFNPLKGDQSLYCDRRYLKEIRTNIHQGIHAELILVFEWMLPKDLSEGAARNRNIELLERPDFVDGTRSQELVPVCLTFTYSIFGQDKSVRAKVLIENQAIHHRLRLSIPSVDNTDSPLQVGSHFCHMLRDWQDGRGLYTTFPILDWVHFPSNKGHGLAFWGEGLYEGEARINENGNRELLVTLLRSLDTIGPAAGMNFEVEGIKMLEPYWLHFGFGPSPHYGLSRRISQDALSPLLSEGLQDTVILDSLPSDLLSWSSDSEYVTMTALKPVESGNGFIVRFLNDSSQVATIKLSGMLGNGNEIREVRLDETELEADQSHYPKIMPHSLCTLCIKGK